MPTIHDDRAPGAGGVFDFEADLEADAIACVRGCGRDADANVSIEGQLSLVEALCFVDIAALSPTVPLRVEVFRCSR